MPVASGIFEQRLARISGSGRARSQAFPQIWLADGTEHRPTTHKRRWLPPAAPLFRLPTWTNPSSWTCASTPAGSFLRRRTCPSSEVLAHAPIVAGWPTWRAQTLLGEFLEKMEKQKGESGGRPRKDGKPATQAIGGLLPPTLSDLGLTYNQSSEAPVVHRRPRTGSEASRTFRRIAPPREQR